MSGIASYLFPHSRVSQQLKAVANDAWMLKITAEELEVIRLDENGCIRAEITENCRLLSLICIQRHFVLAP
ncbi:hypothetical protein IC611_20960 [Proteus mirabilis]